MFTYILTALIAIILWETLKDVLNIRNIFDKYDGLSSEEKLAIRQIEEKKFEKQRELEKLKKPPDLIDD